MAKRVSSQKTIALKDIERALGTNKKTRTAVMRLLVSDHGRELAKHLEIVPRLPKSRLR